MKNNIMKLLNMLIILMLLLGLTTYPVAAKVQEKMPSKGFIKVAYDYENIIALHQNGTVWELPLFEEEKALKIADGVVDIEAGESTYFIVKKDGSLWAWGSNEEGQFAEINIVGSSKPVKILEGVKSVSTSGPIVAVIKKDNSVWTWGTDKLSGTKLKSNKPVKVFYNAKIITSGYFEINIIDFKATLYSLGFDEDREQKIVKKVTDGVLNAKGSTFIKNDSTLWSQTQFYSEKKFKNILKDAVYTDSYISANCAIKKDGSLWAWGISDDNIPGDIAGSDMPVKIMDGIKYADCSYESIVAVKKDGSLCAWGGISPFNHFSIPRNVMGNVKKVLKDGLVLCTDETLWHIEYSMDRYVKTKLLTDVTDVLDDGLIIRKDGTKWSEFLDYNGKPTTFKYPDDTKKIIEGVILKNDGTVWTSVQNPDTGEIEDFLQCGDGIKDVTDIVLAGSSKCIFAKKTDGSFWVWRLYEASDTPKELLKPYKLSEGIKEFIGVDSYVFAVRDNGELINWNISSEKFDKSQLVAKIITDNIKGFGKSDQKIIALVKNDNSLWLFENNIYDWLVQKVDFISYINNDMKRITDNIEEISYYSMDVLLYKKGDLYIRNFSKINNQDLYYNKAWVYEKVMDKVKSVDFSFPIGLALCTDNSLWEFGNYKNLDNKTKAKLEDIKPKLVLEKVKTYKTDGRMNIALMENKSMYTWGDNKSGELGNERETFVEKPGKVMDNISEVRLGLKDIALKKNGDLLFWGTGFVMSHEQPYTRTPLNFCAESKTPVILHQSYAAVRVGESIDILVKITKADFEHDVYIILGNGLKIIMKPCAGGYYEAALTGIEKEGYVKYKIQAVNIKGNKVETDYYNVQVVMK